MSKTTWQVTFYRDEATDTLYVKYPGWMATQRATVDDVTRYMTRHNFKPLPPVIDGEVTTVTYYREFDVAPLDKELRA